MESINNVPRSPQRLVGAKVRPVPDHQPQNHDQNPAEAGRPGGL